MCSVYRSVGRRSKEVALLELAQFEELEEFAQFSSDQEEKDRNYRRKEKRLLLILGRVAERFGFESQRP